jgi:hypothetical protein
MSDALTPSLSSPEEDGTSVHDPSDEPVGGAESVPDPQPPYEPDDDELSGIER